MLNHNGQLKSINSVLEISLLINHLESIRYTETVRVKDNKIFFWDIHYFNLMAFLRLARVDIPEKFSMDYLKSEVLKTLKSPYDQYLVDIHFTINPKKIGTETTEVDFFIVPNKQNNLKSFSTGHETDVYDELRIISNPLANQTNFNRLVFDIATVYGAENNLNSVILINQDRHIVESNEGTLFLYNKTKDRMLTPSLESGCRNLALRSDFIDYLNRSTNIQLTVGYIETHTLKKVDEIFALSIEKGITNISLYRGSYYSAVEVEKLFKNYLIKRGLV
ncbi:MAG: aminotransferase class IV [Flavobacteriaceae bacterium]|nr:aminotransferase class IV [Flavobacteriaceae bacterium]